MSLAPSAPHAIALSTSKSTLGWLHSYSLRRLIWLLDIRLPSCRNFSSSIMAFSSLIRQNFTTLAASKMRTKYNFVLMGRLKFNCQSADISTHAYAKITMSQYFNRVCYVLYEIHKSVHVTSSLAIFGYITVKGCNNRANNVYVWTVHVHS